MLAETHTRVQEMVLQGCQAEIPAKKLKRGHKKIFWPNFGWFYQKQAEKGPQKICILYIKNQIYHSYHS